MKITLSHLEKLELESRHKICRDKRGCDRIKAILLSAIGNALDSRINDNFQTFNFLS